MSASKRIVLAIACFVLAPAMSYAQASIAGVVKDASGAIMPGVTVEAASPVLIERVRSVVTDGTGQYKIVDLRPGTYSVTFSLPGFSTREYQPPHLRNVKLACRSPRCSTSRP